MHRFFVEIPVSSDAVYLTGSEAHHLLHVLRASIGTEVLLWDGTGAEFEARVVRIDRRGAELEVLSRHEVDRELPFSLTLGVSLPKGDRQRWLVEKAVELGVSMLVPLETEHSAVLPATRTLTRLKKVVVESSKQCRRNRLMQVAQPQSLVDYLNLPPQHAVRIVAHPTERNLDASREDMRILLETDSREVYVAIGPEGGFTQREMDCFQKAGWQQVDMGPRILRVETAAIALVAFITMREGTRNDPVS